MASFTKSLPDNNQVRVQYFYTRSKVVDWGGAMFFVPDDAAGRPDLFPDRIAIDMQRALQPLIRPTPSLRIGAIRTTTVISITSTPSKGRW